MWATVAAIAMSHATFGQEVGVGEKRPVDDRLEPTPLTIEALSLRFNPPRDANTIAENANGSVVITVSDNSNTPAWTMRVQQMTSSLPKPSPEAQIDDLLAELTRTGTAHKLLSNDAKTVGGLTGRLCYIERVARAGDAVISGWLVLPLGKAEFMVFAVQCLPDSFATMRGAFDAVFGTIDVRTGEQRQSDRVARITHGGDFLRALTPEQLKSLAGFKQWSRISKPAMEENQASTEVGYALIETLAAKRGALNPNRDEAKYKPSEHEEGLLVRVQGRYIVNAARKIHYDSIALYWLAWDQSEESWSVRGTQRQGEAESSEAETGIREPASTSTPKPRLNVIKSTDVAEPVPSEWEVPDVYLSQALGWVIGRLLPRDIKETQEYAWYFYVGSSAHPRVYQRTDRWEKTNEGTFTLTTTLSPETPPFTTTYAEDGTFLRRVHGDGSITEPIELEALRKLWKAKGLPVGSGDR